MSLYAWQAEALHHWYGIGCRGVVEAVTGTGKTMLGIVAAERAVREGKQVLVLVPSIELMGQWRDQLAQRISPHRIGLAGDGNTDGFHNRDLVVAVINSATQRRIEPTRDGGLLIADECHHYGAETFSAALHPRWDARLGLTATYERADDGLAEHLDPYFGGICFQIGYRRAIAEHVIANFNVALLGVPFSPSERAAYGTVDEIVIETRRTLVRHCGVPGRPFGEFMKAVSTLAQDAFRDRCTNAASRYLEAFSERRAILANATAKYRVLFHLAPAFEMADRSLVFTNTREASYAARAVLEQAGTRGDVVESETPRGERREVMNRFRRGLSRVVIAPRVLDEGVDVPAADLGVIVAASQRQLQMIQRMGRVLRPKVDGRMARFVILFVEGTSEDPARGAHEDFLEEVTDVANQTRTFTTEQTSDLIDFVAPAPRPVTPPLMSEALRERLVSSPEAETLRAHMREPAPDMRLWLAEHTPTELLPALVLADYFDHERTAELERVLDEIGVEHIRRALELTDGTVRDSRFLRWLVLRERESRPPRTRKPDIVSRDSDYELPQIRYGWEWLRQHDAAQRDRRAAAATPREAVCRSCFLRMRADLFVKGLCPSCQ